METGPESGAKWVTGELEPAVNVEGGALAPLAPSEWWNPGGALSAAPEAEIPQGACSKLPVVETGPRRSADAKWVTGELEPAVSVEGGALAPLAPSDWWNPGGALSAAPGAEIPQVGRPRAKGG